jgi:tetratricopeptide (TPR) repeat protein
MAPQSERNEFDGFRAAAEELPVQEPPEGFARRVVMSLRKEDLVVDDLARRRERRVAWVAAKWAAGVVLATAAGILGFYLFLPSSQPVSKSALDVTGSKSDSGFPKAEASEPEKEPKREEAEPRKKTRPPDRFQTRTKDERLPTTGDSPGVLPDANLQTEPEDTLIKECEWLERTERREDALDCYQLRLRLSPDSAEAHLAYAKILEKNGFRYDSLRYKHKYLVLTGANEKAKEVARILENPAKYKISTIASQEPVRPSTDGGQRAMEYYREAFETKDSDPQGSMEKLAKAASLLPSSNERFRSQVERLRSRIRGNVREKEHQQAQELLSQAQALQTDDPRRAYQMLAQASTILPPGYDHLQHRLAERSQSIKARLPEMPAREEVLSALEKHAGLMSDLLQAHARVQAEFKESNDLTKPAKISFSVGSLGKVRALRIETEQYKKPEFRVPFMFAVKEGFQVLPFRMEAVTVTGVLVDLSGFEKRIRFSSDFQIHPGDRIKKTSE